MNSGNRAVLDQSHASVHQGGRSRGATPVAHIVKSKLDVLFTSPASVVEEDINMVSAPLSVVCRLSFPGGINFEAMSVMVDSPDTIDKRVEFTDDLLN